MRQGTEGRKGARDGDYLRRRGMAAGPHRNRATGGDPRCSKAAKWGRGDEREEAARSDLDARGSRATIARNGRAPASGAVQGTDKRRMWQKLL
jgi:hypothetical protein